MAGFGQKQSFTATMPKVRLPIRKQPFGRRSANGQLVQQSERDLKSFLVDYNEAKRNKARNTPGRPPWWNKNN